MTWGALLCSLFAYLVSVGSVEPHWCDDDESPKAVRKETVEAVSVGSVEPHWCDSSKA